MKLGIGKTYHGFKLLKQEDIDEIKCAGLLFEHEKSGARLFKMECDDDNKVFSISFRTPPENSKGIPHIIEHTVLCGSKKFPLKDPFIELAKGSLNTFLNAITFSDKTMYPVASRNEKDFFNLMDVYLDAVFNPDIYRIPEIFRQEGWHYELNNKDDRINYKGVVYNEMKGAFSSPESVLFRKVQESLYPDTPYSVESGGDPDCIPDLTIDEFLDFHRKYYHPSNSYIFLYGNGDLQKELEFLDKNYLSSFNRIDVDSRIPLQKPFDRPREINAEYPVSNNDDLRDKTFLDMNFSVGKSTDPEASLAFEILEHLLLETPAAPLKKALIDANIGKDVFGRFDNSIQQMVFSIVVKNSNEDKMERFKEVVRGTLENLAERGIDKKLIEASINIKEFELREADFRGYPKGLIYNIKCMDSWLYGEDPTLHLRFEPSLNKIESALKTDYFEKLIKEYLLDNTHCSMIILKPERGLQEKKDKAIRRELDDYKAKLSESELQKIIDDTARLRKRQSTPDSKEAIETIPLLSISDIKKEEEKLPTEVHEESNVKVLLHPIFTSGIAYLTLYFDARSLPWDLIPYAGLLAEILGRVSLEKLSYGDLSNEININTGGIDFTVESYSKNGSFDEYYPQFVVKSKCLITKIGKLSKLINEIIKYTRFDEEKRIRDIVSEAKSRFEMILFNQGHLMASRRVLSYFSPMGKFDEAVNGISFYKFLCSIERDFDIDDIGRKLESAAELIFNRSNLLVSFVSPKEDYGKLKEILPEITSALNDNRIENAKIDFRESRLNEGLLTQGRVQYVAKGYNFVKLGFKYTGYLQVLRTIASYDYLWNKVRVEGGAYGAFAGFGRGGNMYLSSYRDPNLKETIDVFDNMAGYLKSFNVSDRDMTKYIIGTISRLDYPLTPSLKGQKADIEYISGITYEDMQRERGEVIDCRTNNIRDLSDMIDATMKAGYFCVLGNENKIKQNKGMFESLVKVIE
ncbi:MAG: insulinase family protein [Clostridiales bacterium]|nr:insulinase family protein [Clostridiales bacterium]